MLGPCCIAISLYIMHGRPNLSYYSIITTTTPVRPATNMPRPTRDARPALVGLGEGVTVVVPEGLDDDRAQRALIQSLATTRRLGTYNDAAITVRFKDAVVRGMKNSKDLGSWSGISGSRPVDQRRVTYTLDPTGHVVRVVDAVGIVTRFGEVTE